MTNVTCPSPNTSALALGHDYDAFVIDTSEDESATTAMDRNLRGAASFYKRMQPNAVAIQQARGMIHRFAELAVLELPDHSNQACEVYCVFCFDGCVNFRRGMRDWQRYAWMKVSANTPDMTQGDFVGTGEKPCFSWRTAIVTMLACTYRTFYKRLEYTGPHKG
ncbi:uncharacterized protein LDX57_008625 [Aspergillus melleus]|uniref:uncharacterized protein n=1 Tax=Aspergillus melleus TaxID=138277 RepID=UPI001E8EDC05|nr:uncharacterized protein LDX57_008625 [Aspergillus melleus]KAH8430963.1 hypothetical protein LDX57_008625 [Aspergillus melleus]